MTTIRARGLWALLAMFAAGCDDVPGPADATVRADATDAVEIDVRVGKDVRGVDALARDVTRDVGFDRPVPTGEVGGEAGVVRSCAELMRFFDCEGDLHTCFQFDPSGDQGACDMPGLFCENWNNCRTPGSRRVLDWDCFCEAAGTGTRWRCTVRQVCDAGVVRD